MMFRFLDEFGHILQIYHTHHGTNGEFMTDGLCICNKVYVYNIRNLFFKFFYRRTKVILLWLFDFLRDKGKFLNFLFRSCEFYILKMQIQS